MRYQAAESLEQAVEWLSRSGGEYLPLAGGTDLLAQRRVGRIDPQGVVDLKRIPELGEIVSDDDGWVRATAAQIEEQMARVS